MQGSGSLKGIRFDVCHVIYYRFSCAPHSQPPTYRPSPLPAAPPRYPFGSIVRHFRCAVPFQCDARLVLCVRYPAPVQPVSCFLPAKPFRASLYSEHCAPTALRCCCNRIKMPQIRQRTTWKGSPLGCASNLWVKLNLYCAWAAQN